MSSLWFSSPERFGLEDDGFEDIDSPPRDMSLLRNQVQSVFQAQMNKETTTAFLDHSQNESCSPFDHLFPSREDNCFTPSMPTFSSSEMPVLSNSIAPPAPPAPPVPQMRRHQNYHYNMAYHGAPSGLYPYSGTSSTSLNGYTPYLPEEVFQPSSPQAPAALATPRLGSATISQLPNPFTTAYGHTPKPPTIPLAPPPAQPLTARKLAAAARPRDASGKFAPRSKVTDDQSSDPTIIVTVSNPSSKLKSPSLTYISPAHPTYPSPQSYTSPPANYTPSSLQRSPHSYSSPALPSSPEMLEAHVATLQQQLAQEKAESERLRALLDQTQSELMQLKLNATHWPPLNQHNKRARSISSIDSASWHSDVFQN